MPIDKSKDLRAKAEKHFREPAPVPTKSDRERAERNASAKKIDDKTQRLKAQRLARDVPGKK